MSKWFDQELDSSKFAMWRAAIAIIHSDGKVSLEEQKWIDQKLASLNFSEKQKKILKQDIELGANLESLLLKITDKKDRAFLLHLTRVIGHLDQDFSEKEREDFQTIRRLIVGQTDIQEMEEHIVESSYDHHKKLDRNKEHSLLWRGLDFFVDLFS